LAGDGSAQFTLAEALVAMADDGWNGRRVYPMCTCGPVSEPVRRCFWSLDQLARWPHGTSPIDN